MISELVDIGVSILLISSGLTEILSLPEVMGMADRVLVMHEGRSKAILDKSEASQETIMSAALVPGVSREVS